VLLNNPFLPPSNIFPLLPQLTSLIVDSPTASIQQCVKLSTSLKLLSLSLCAIRNLNSDTQAIIRDSIERLRILIGYNPRSDPHTALSAIITGSRVMKKVIVDGSKPSNYGESVNDTMGILVPMCKKAKVELWKEKFKVGNGKVDLNLK
jgi:hypothetical protein